MVGKPRASTEARTTTTAADGGAPARGYWRGDEEQALKRAVRKHGIGAWEKMRNDPEFIALRCGSRAMTRAWCGKGEGWASRGTDGRTPTT